MSGRVVPKRLIEKYVKAKLAEDPRWTIKALIKIHQLQTPIEKAQYGTSVRNDVGFNSFDAEILSSIADQWTLYHRVSVKQWAILIKRMPKYWKQVVMLSDADKLADETIAFASTNLEQIELSFG